MTKTCAGWVVVVGEGSMSSCYGIFSTYDDAVQWLKRNGWTTSECQVYPIRDVLRASDEGGG